ncbi:DUF6445 family protein [Shewanella intestini]|uniref:Uncharacterized protein n=1 Tax=Shewanella intestini TaxID=2017544 RepID=A0ABS5I0J4_9GAMM|nr:MULTISPECIES: DUF6445 family protein [Shewanella]MBR9726830.1 hypothetical protein [Shewanella intestini]MRG34604.1 hypothetical protein [Shewanella sp. XMDDZSB0408]
MTQQASPSIIEVNTFRPQVIRIGNQQTPVIIIDDFAKDLSTLRQVAANSTFEQQDSSYYPGVRAPLPQSYPIEVINQVFQLIYDVYAIPKHLRIKPQNWVFSLISQAPATLMPLQRLPHFDTPDPFHFAILHYLNDAPYGATGFFRHKSTGYERINQQNIDHYFDSANAFLTQHKQATPSYFTDSDEHYELYEQIAYKANRLVIYPGSLLHSTLVNPATDIDSSVHTGRLTANIFLQFS